MRSRYHVLVVLMSLAGCAASSVEPTASVGAVADASAPPVRKHCDEVLTGSRIPQCNRGDVKVMTREEVERAGLLSNPATANADAPLLPGRTH
jgi:hypothetical protein